MYICPSVTVTHTCAHTWQREDDKPKADQSTPKLSKAQIKVQHAESNRKLWESAYVLCPTTPSNKA